MMAMVLEVRQCSDDDIGQSVDAVFVDGATPAAPFNASHAMNAMTRQAYPVNYEFKQSDKKFLQNDGMCVVDKIDNIYGHLNNTFSKKIM